MEQDGTKLPPFRWVADAIMILNNAENEIDWNRLAAQAEKRHLILPLLDTLQYLRDTFAAQIAPEIIENLQSVHVPHLERMEYKIAVNPVTKWTAILDLWCQHSRLTENIKYITQNYEVPGISPEHMGNISVEIAILRVF